MSISEALYNKSPRVFQEIAMSAYSLKRRMKRNSSYQQKHLQFLMESYYWDKQQIREFQYTELKKVLVFARENSKHYSFLSRDMIDQVVNNRDLSLLPIMDKSTLINDFDCILTKAKGLNYFYTSGSTGTPMKIALTDEEWAMEYAFVWRQRKLAGISFNDKVASFTGRKVVSENNPSSFWRYNIVDRQLLFSAYHMIDRNLEKYINKFNRSACMYVQGYPSLIFTLARYALDRRLKLAVPRAIFTSSETLLDYQRDTIEKAFNSKVYDYYGNTERAGIITQCEFGRYHVNIESGILENINGRLIWTSFINRTTPLIRYDIGDLGYVDYASNQCRCGSHSPVLSKIEGRDVDLIYTRDNRPLGGILEHIFKKDLRIKEAQIVQEVRGAILIKVVPDSGFSEQEVFNRIRKNFQEKVGNSLTIRLETVQDIPRNKNGKFKFIISKLSLTQSEGGI